MGVEDLVALADATHVGAASLAVGSAIRFLATQDARVREDSQDEIPMEPTMHGRLATVLTTSVCRMPDTPDGDDGGNESM
jgi:NAD(P)H-dependent flavin oxidoreductase YrpB (nitropropane dioxygenase family)